MRYLAMTAAGLGLLAMTAATSVNPASAGDRFELQAPIHLAQAEVKKPEAKKPETKPEAKKSETVTQKVKRKSKEVKQKVKRAWRDMTGYKFNVGCPALIPLTRSTCTENGKDRETARATCQQKNLLCSVTDAK